MLRSRAMKIAGLVCVPVVLLAVACGGAARRAEEAAALYNQGKYAEALPILQALYDDGRRDGASVYQLGYCRYEIDRDAGARRTIWGEAEPLLDREIQTAGAATLERLYYLTSINASENDMEAVRKYARRAIEVGEKDGDPNALSGEDWFRLGRMHDFLGENSDAEAAYRRSVSAFERIPAKNPTYRALARVRVADQMLRDQRFDEAAAAYDEASKALPGSPHIPPFRHALALLGVGRFEEAAARFAQETDPETITEAQYGADLARKAIEAAPVEARDADGTLLHDLPRETLVERVVEAGRALRTSREKYAVRTGDPIPAEVRDRQRRFVALLIEAMLRDGGIQALTLEKGVADLVRR
jgi:tetratricopeptide (TPR) repeat protein